MAATAMGVIAEAMSLAGRLREINKTIGNAEFSGLLAELQLELAEAKARIADLVAQNSELRTQLSEREAAAALVGEMTFDGQVYRKENDSSAYCPTCFDSDGKPIRMSALSPPLNRSVQFLCGKCKTTVGWGTKR
jgi:hypothetical protein